jgi:chromosomal replication initiator protein
LKARFAWQMIRGMNDYWNDCLEQLRGVLPKVQFERWIAPLELVSAGNLGVEIRAPNRMVVNWVRERAMHVFGPLAEEHFAPGVPVQIAAREHAADPQAEQTDSASKASSPQTLAIQDSQSVAPAAGERRRLTQRSRSAGISSAFTFDSFVVGKANQMARAAALQVAESPGSDYNPLFVYGCTGLGKTHLMQAVGNALLARDPNARVRYVHANEYIGDVVKAYQNRSFDEFKQYYRSLDLLLIDDVHFFSGKEKTQEEFFYAFNYLIDEQKQVIITSDTLPKDITGLEERLVSRFGYGLTVAIEPPELEMRVAILLAKAKAEKLELGQDVAFFIARHIRSNVRELEGALKRVVAFNKFSGGELDIESAKLALRDVLASFNREPPIEQIRKVVSEYYGIRESELSGSRKTRTIVVPRQIAMSLCRELTQKSLPEIGENFGGRDHTTVLHACRRIDALRREDSAIGQAFDTLVRILRN